MKTTPKLPAGGAASLRALIVEASEAEAHHLLVELSRGFALAHRLVRDEASLVSALGEQPWDVVICDYSLPGLDGVAALELVRERFPDLPFIVVSGTTGEEVAVAAMRAGVDDYLLKGSLARLVPAVERELRRRAERRRAERALAASDARLHAVLDQIPVIVWTTDRDLRFVTTAGGGLKSFDVIACGGTVPELLAGSPSGDRAAACHRLALSGAPAQYELTWRERSYEVNVQPLRGDDGTIVGTVGAALDVTDQRKLEAQLRAAQRMEAVGRLAGGIAHDFNNVLTVIESYGALLQAQITDESAAEDVAVIRQSARRAADLVRQLLAFSRRQPMIAEVLDLNEVISELDPMLRRMVGEHIHVEISLAPSLGKASADRAQVEQVITNLVVNARDAMIDGGELTIETQNVEVDLKFASARASMPTGSYVLLAVSDTGVGMDADVLERVFEPFFTTKDVGHGTGLGLSTVYGIIKQSGGWIWVDSQRGGGTTFEILLPRSDEEGA